MANKNNKHTLLRLKITGLIVGFFLLSWSLIASKDIRKIKENRSTEASDQALSAEEEFTATGKEITSGSISAIPLKDQTTSIKNNTSNITSSEKSTVLGNKSNISKDSLSNGKQRYTVNTGGNLSTDTINIRTTDPGQPDTNTSTT